MGSTAVTMLTVALANWVLSASEVTVTVAVPGVDGAVYKPRIGIDGAAAGGDAPGNGLIARAGHNDGGAKCVGAGK